jgi:hypothetical protein
MRVPSSTAICVAALMLLVGSASADPWKDESGKGRWRGGGYGWDEPERKFKFRTPDGEVEREWKKGEYESKESASAVGTATDTDAHLPALLGSGGQSAGASRQLGERQLVALLGPRERSDLSQQSGAKRT